MSSQVPADPNALEKSLEHIVNNSQVYTEGGKDQLAPSEKRADAVHSHGPESRAWIAHFFPNAETLDRLFAYEHMGNYVIERTTGAKIFESMPLYVRVGMHLLFVSGNEFMTYKRVEKLLEDQSIKQGKVYDQTGVGVLEHIQAFVKTYELPLNELLVQDLAQYPTFNAFFARKLIATARPITARDDPTIIVSPADCRISVFPTVDVATQLWIKGKEFTIPHLLLGQDMTDKSFDIVLQNEKEYAIAVCRLAPQDYHRFHSPVEGEVVYTKDISGQLYTVNPQAVNEDLNVFTLNKRSVMLINANLGPGREKTPVVFVAIGAMLVGSIGWSKKPGDRILKGEELGWFQYGGSTCILVIPSAAGVQFDKDLLATSQKQMETVVRVGMEIGKVGTPGFGGVTFRDVK